MKKWLVKPGTFEYTGEVKKQTIFSHIQYSHSGYQKQEGIGKISTDVMNLILVEGLTDNIKIANMCNEQGIDHLVIEDILNVHQRTKLEQFENYWFFVINYPYYDGNTFIHDYMSIVFFEHVMFVFTEGENRFIKPLIKRLEANDTFIHEYGHDYLLYVFYDMMVDEMMLVNSVVTEQLETMEDELLELDQNDQVHLYEIRKELTFLRTNLMQLLRVLNNQTIKNSTLITQEVQKYFIDVQDHLHRLRNDVFSSIDQVGQMLDIYLNHVSNRMNQIMTTLTIFSAIFIPLSFLAGVFGMNFTNFPILKNDYGMLYFIITSVTLSLGMLGYFKFRKWF
jgi:magnesium transporter